jgi:hypothetical protein
MKHAFFASATFAAAVLFSTAAQAVVIDYSVLSGLPNYGVVPSGIGSSASATLDYKTLNGFGNGSVSTPYVEFWNGGYSSDDAIFASYNGGVLQVTLSAAPGLNISSLILNLGGYFNTNQTVEYRVYDGAYNLLLSDSAFDITGANGGTALALVLNTSTAIFQMGFDWNSGINMLEYNTVNANPSAVPLPGALVLFGTALAGVAGISRRRRKKAA